MLELIFLGPYRGFQKNAAVLKRFFLQPYIL
jgi:hypothetical protein